MNTKDTMTEQQTETSLKNSVISRIEAEDLAPRSRWVYRSKEYVVWFLWGVSVIFGIFSVSVSIYVLSHAHYAMYEATHNNFLTFMVEFLPYAWMGVFALMVISAYYNFRNTKRGYKYPISHILVSSLVFSLVGGVALQFVGMGYYLDHELGKRMPLYTSMEKRDLRLWQAPEEGRLVGQMARTVNSQMGIIAFIDMNGREWRVATVDLYEPDIELLESGKRVKLVGMMKDGLEFHSCGVFPWLHDWSVGVSDLSRERDEFIDRMMTHKKPYDERPYVYEQAVYATTSRFAPMGACAEMAMFARFR